MKQMALVVFMPFRQSNDGSSPQVQTDVCMHACAGDISMAYRHTAAKGIRLAFVPATRCITGSFFFCIAGRLDSL